MAAARQAPRGLIFPRGTGFPDAREWIPFWTQTIYRQSGNPAIRQSGNPAIISQCNPASSSRGVNAPAGAGNEMPHQTSQQYDVGK
ncbi:hypothetical protein ACVCIC_04060 [Burkholderia glumae]|uniref:Uncharacterized protein n=1 Tax=Burkholderia glumae TaxID=337 RepID=A0ABY5B971_BURGL|nr:hypothetical protein [Burkholderia glumae]MCM2541301.1 hypothetical protein [Burkholderia glumae]QHE13388.1 hypothetical protein GQR88_24415 [Burkholderia glumae AU6208]USS43575.1 hypothetical protein NFI99_03710 [Burkholderia glumae]